MITCFVITMLLFILWIIKKRPRKLILTWIVPCIFILFFGIPYVINQLYGLNDGYYTLWDAPDVLSFYGSVLSFLGTVILGAIAVWQNKNANEINKKLLDKELNESCSFATVLSVDWKSTIMNGCTTRFENLHSMESTNVMYIENVPIDDYKDRHFVEYLFRFTLENTSNSKIKSAKIISKSIKVFNDEPMYISSFIHHCNNECTELLLNWENKKQFSTFIKFYAFNGGQLEKTLNDMNRLGIIFTIEYTSQTNQKTQITHQIWLKKDEENKHIVLGVRNTELEDTQND